MYVNSMSWNVSVENGDIGVCIWFGALVMHRSYRAIGISLGFEVRWCVGSLLSCKREAKVTYSN